MKNISIKKKIILTLSVLVIIAFGFMFMKTYGVNKVKNLAWTQLPKELSEGISKKYFFNHTNITEFTVTPEYEYTTMTEYTIPFDYDKYKGKRLSLIVYDDKKVTEPKVLLIFIDTENDKMIGVKKGYFIKDDQFP